MNEFSLVAFRMCISFIQLVVVNTKKREREKRILFSFAVSELLLL